MQNPTTPIEVQSKRLSGEADELLLASFDPVIEGASFQIIEEGLEPSQIYSTVSGESPEEIPEVISTFDLGESLSKIPNKLFFKIGEVADLLELKPYVLRFWETEFPMVSPAKSRTGQRVYRKKEVETLFLIKHLLYVERFSIEGARKRIRELKGKKSLPTPSVARSEPQTSVDRSKLHEGLEEIKRSLALPISRFFRF